MARCKSVLPLEVINEMRRLEEKTSEMIDEMLNAGADGVMERIKEHAPTQIARNSQIMSSLWKTRVYNTKSDNAINIKVAFWGYYKGKVPFYYNKIKKEETPIPLIVNLFEYGRSDSPFPKHPFVRRSFAKNRVEADMLKIQEKYLPKE